MKKGATLLLVLAMGTAASGCNAGAGKALLATYFVAVTAVHATAMVCGAEEVDCSGGPAAEPVYTGGHQEPYSVAVDW